MDVEKLHLVLQQSFAAEAAIRQPAEEIIRNLRNVPGSIQLLLQVAAEHQVRFEVRQAAAIQLKNICREGWVQRTLYPIERNENATDPASPERPPPTSSILSDHDKEITKHKLIEALLLESVKSVRDLLAETLQFIVLHDFPDNWPNLVPILIETIKVGVTDMDRRGLEVHNALVALRKITKRYEYRSREQRGPLNDIVIVAFPLLLPLAQVLSDPNQHSIEAAMMLKQILKIFWSSTQFYLPSTSPPSANDNPSATNSIDNNASNTTDVSTNTPDNQVINSSIGLAKRDHLQPWFDVVTLALKKPLPEASTGLEPRGQPVDVKERNAWPWWKVKKWAVQIMSRLFSRYGIPSYADDDHAKEFAIFFSQTVAPQFLGPVCDTLSLRPTGQFCTDRVVHLCLTFLALAVELASTYRLLRPHLDFLLYQVCFPTMCLKPDDIDCFENDPIEFVQKQNSPVADFYDPRMSAITLVTDLVKHRGQDVTQNLLSKMTSILQTYAAATTPEQQNHIEKDCALLTFGSLAKYLLKDKYMAEVEGLLVTSVFPDFESPVSYLRYRACWMVRQFSAVQWSDDGTHLRTVLEKVLNRLTDPALPVQIEASKAIRFLIETNGAESTLLPVLPQLLHEYFRIMNEIGNDEVVSALQVLLDKFGDHIEPHALMLITQLSNAFNQYCQASEADEDDDVGLAAAQCLECISTVLKGVCSKESILHNLEPILMPLVLKILGNDGEFLEYLECALDILTFLTFFQTRITPDVWQAFPLIYLAFDQWAYDYLNTMVPCIQSYIAKAPDVFLAGRAELPEGNIPYVDLVYSMVAKTISNDSASEMECRHAFSLFMCILHNCPGQVDAYIPFLNEVVLGKLGQLGNNDSVSTRTSIYQVLGSALYYQPHLEILQLENRGITQQVLSKWITDTEQMNRWLPRKLTVLGFASILTIPLASLPQSITSIIPQLLNAMVRVALDLKADTEKGDVDGNDGIEEEEGDENVVDDEDNVDVDNGFREDQDVTNEVDEAYRRALWGVTNWDDMQKFLTDDWDDDGEDVDEDYTSPIDNVEELLLLTDTIKFAFQREPDAYQQVQSAMPTEAITAVQTLFAAADTMRSQAAAAVAAASAASVLQQQQQQQQQGGVLPQQS